MYIPLPEAQLEKANRKHAFTKFPKRRKENSSPTKRGEEGGRVSASHLAKDQLQEAQEKLSICLKKCYFSLVLTECPRTTGFLEVYIGEVMLTTP